MNDEICINRVKIGYTDLKEKETFKHLPTKATFYKPSTGFGFDIKVKYSTISILTENLCWAVTQEHKM